MKYRYSRFSKGYPDNPEIMEEVACNECGRTIGGGEDAFFDLPDTAVYCCVDCVGDPASVTS